MNILEEYTGGGEAEARAKKNPNLIAPELRLRATMSREIGDGAKVLFHHLTDESFVYPPAIAPGILKLSQVKLAGVMGCDKKTVWRRRTELEQAGFVSTEVRWEGGREITLWFIRGMADDAKLARRRVDGANPHMGRVDDGKSRRFVPRGTSGQFCPPPTEVPESAESPMIPPISGQDCPRPTGTSAPGQRAVLTVDSGHQRPRTAGKNARGQRADLTIDSGQICPLPAGTAARGPGAELPEYKRSETEIEVENPKDRGGKGNPAPPIAKSFEEELGEMFRSKRERLLAELQGMLQQSNGKERRAELKRRIKLVKESLAGGNLPEDLPAEAAPKTKPAAQAPVEEKPASDEELLEAAGYWLKKGRLDRLTPRMRELAEKAGLGVGK